MTNTIETTDPIATYTKLETLARAAAKAVRDLEVAALTSDIPAEVKLKVLEIGRAHV